MRPTKTSRMHRSNKLMDWMSIYDSSLLVSLGPIREDDIGTKWSLLVWQVQCSYLHIISQSQYFQHWSCSPYKFKKSQSTSFHSHINLGWLGNLRFNYSINLWRRCLATCCLSCSTNAITARFAIACCKKHPFSTNTKAMLMWAQTHKALVVFVLSSTTVTEVN